MAVRVSGGHEQGQSQPAGAAELHELTEIILGVAVKWADDWEASGATDPMTRPKLCPWLRGQRGPYDGLVAAAVDRLGRQVVDCLDTGCKMRDECELLVTYGHGGAWDLDDQLDENRFTMQAWGVQMELRAIQRRDRNANEKTRAAGRPKGKPSYGFQYVRTAAPLPTSTGRCRSVPRCRVTARR
ncbi:recombinase family protein [Streptomyces sp. SID4985]|uniref:recombinase family protein n=1 Tax=Streptomyces sp. SID4985 TaxID=2690292 RepID=UPI00136DCEEB|nr:recombinase family protein [Streptomyces sp. SID4985]